MQRKHADAYTAIKILMDTKPPKKTSTHESIRVSLREMKARVLYFFL